MKNKTHLTLTAAFMFFLAFTIDAVSKQNDGRVTEGVAMATQAALSTGKITANNPATQSMERNAQSSEQNGLTIRLLTDTKHNAGTFNSL